MEGQWLASTDHTYHFCFRRKSDRLRRKKAHELFRNWNFSSLRYYISTDRYRRLAICGSAGEHTIWTVFLFQEVYCKNGYEIIHQKEKQISLFFIQNSFHYLFIILSLYICLKFCWKLFFISFYFFDFFVVCIREKLLLYK